MNDSDNDYSFQNHQNIQQSFNIQEHMEMNDINRKKEDSVISDLSDVQQPKGNNLLMTPIDAKAANYQCKTYNSPLNNFKTSIEASSRFIDASSVAEAQPSYGCSPKHNRKKKETAVSAQSNMEDQGPNMEASNMMQSQIAKEPRRLMLAINLLVNVMGFYRRVTQNSRILEKLSREQHNQIGDVASFFIKNQFNKKKVQIRKLVKFFDQIFRKVNFILKFIPIFAPYSRFKQIWDYIQAILEMIVSFLFSLYIFFQLDVQVYSNFFLLCFMLFICDVLVNFNTGILQEGTVVYKRKSIAKEYVKQNFIFDVVGLLPFMNYFWIGGAAYSQGQIDTVLISTLISMKWFSLGANLSKISFFLSYQKGMKNSLDLIKLIFLMLCVCHSFSLVWHGIAIYEIQTLGRQDSWLQAFSLVDQNVWDRYLYSFYYLTVTMTTTGYGDITPKNYIEVAFAIGIIFITAIFWAFFLNKIGQIIDNMEEKEKQYKSNMLVIHRLMREEEVDKELRVKISNYLKYLYKESNAVQKSQEKEIIDKLSKQLRDDLVLDMNGKYIANIPILEKLQQKNKLAQAMEECLFSPGEYIFKQDQSDDSSIYYIVKGNVSILFESDYGNRNKSNLIQVLGKQQYFGEIGFLFESKRAYAARANNFCRIFKLQRDVFQKIILESEYDFENFQMIKESIIMKDNYKFQKIRCFTCNRGNHLSSNCPKTHLTISKQVHINRYLYSKPQIERVSYARCKKKINSLMTAVLVHNAVFQINDNADFFEYLDNIEEGLNLSDHEQDQDQSEIYNSDQDFLYSEHDLNNNNINNMNNINNNNPSNMNKSMNRQSTMIKHIEDGNESSILEYSTLNKSRSLVKKTSVTVPLQPTRQSQEQNGITFSNQIEEAYQKEEESQLTSSMSSSDDSEDSDEQTSQQQATEHTITNTNQTSISSKQGQRYYENQQQQIIQRKVQSNNTLVRVDSKKLSYNVSQEHSSLANQLKPTSSLLPVTTVLPPSDGLDQGANSKNKSELQNNLLKDNDLHSMGGTHVGSLTSITSRTRVPSRLAAIQDKDTKKNSPTQNSFIDSNFIYNNDPIRSLTKISTHSVSKPDKMQQQHQNSGNDRKQQQQHANAIGNPSNKNDSIMVVGRRNRGMERSSLNKEQILSNQLSTQLQELLQKYQSKKQLKKNNVKTHEVPQQNQRQKVRPSNFGEKLASQLKTLQTLKTGFTNAPHTNQKNIDRSPKNDISSVLNAAFIPSAQNEEEQILIAIKDELENQQMQIENQEEIRDQTNYLNLQEFDKAVIFKYYYKNDNYIQIVERYQEYWKKINILLENKKKQRKKKLKKRLKSKLAASKIH